jgi:putative Mg2+ transporter-C (MgtC) family protein
MNDFLQNELGKLLIALLIGAIIGAEREYRTKSAGFRTVILITVGSCLFTMISNLMSNDARVASNIVTGIGFLGAGAIFKEGANIRGLTTATTIWISAAIGMTVGIGQYIFAFSALAIVMLVLLGFSWLPHWIEKINSEINYLIVIEQSEHFKKKDVEDIIEKVSLKHICTRQKKINHQVKLLYTIKGSQEAHTKLKEHLQENELIVSFEV